jgi:putative transposase
VIQAYRFALDPTPGQNAVLRSHCNWGLALVKANLDQRKAEVSYGMPAAE